MNAADVVLIPVPLATTVAVGPPGRPLFSVPPLYVSVAVVAAFGTLFVESASVPLFVESVTAKWIGTL